VVAGIDIAVVHSMSMFICTSCGTQYAESQQPPAYCAICRADARPQLADRTAWTTLEELRRGHENLIQRLQRDLFSIRSIPAFAAGHRALLLRTEGGNVLWGCVTLIDDATVRMIRALGGLAGIAVSHPRHFSSVIEWSRAFGGVPVHAHTTERRWLMRPDTSVAYWSGQEHQLPGNITLVHVGTYRDGGTLLHWPAASGGAGALLTGDVLQVVTQQTRVGLLSNSRDLVPRSIEMVRRLMSAIEPLSFGALYDAWSDDAIAHGAHDIVLESAKQYIAAVCGQHDSIDPRCSLIA
jgi:hypothetical protein